MRSCLELLRAYGAEVMVLAETSGTLQGRDTPVGDRPRMSEAEWPVFLERVDALGRWMAGEGVQIALTTTWAT